MKRIQSVRFGCRGRIQQLAVALFLGASHPAYPQELVGAQPNACVQSAAAYHRVNPTILQAIIYHESRGNPALVMKNSNGSIDVGLGGLNSVHFAELERFGIGKEQLLDGCTNTYVAAWHLAKQVKQYGNTWTAVGTYHSKTPTHRDRYAAQIYEVLRRWRAVP